MPQLVGVKLLPVAIEVPPVATSYHFTVVPAGLVTVKAGMVLPVQMVLLALVAVGAGGTVQTSVHTAIVLIHHDEVLPKSRQSVTPVTKPIVGKFCATVEIVSGAFKKARAKPNNDCKV